MKNHYSLDTEEERGLVVNQNYYIIINTSNQHVGG